MNLNELKRIKVQRENGNKRVQREKGNKSPKRKGK